LRSFGFDRCRKVESYSYVVLNSMLKSCNIVNSDTYTYKSLPHKIMDTNNYYLRMKRNNLFIRKVLLKSKNLVKYRYKNNFVWIIKIHFVALAISR